MPKRRTSRNGNDARKSSRFYNKGPEAEQMAKGKKAEHRDSNFKAEENRPRDNIKNSAPKPMKR